MWRLIRAGRLEEVLKLSLGSAEEDVLLAPAPKRAGFSALLTLGLGGPGILSSAF